MYEKEDRKLNPVESDRLRLMRMTKPHATGEFLVDRMLL